MKSPLALDKETVKKYSIPANVELHPRQKLAFLEDQLNQIKAMHYRARIDVLHAKRLQESNNEVLKNKGYTNESQHANEVEQTIGAIAMLTTLIEEVRKETGVKETSELDHPEQ
jgi:hypothetical protein